MASIIKPNSNIISQYLKKWEQLENYTLQEKSLGLLFHKLCPKNKNIEEILLKVSALNDFYSTNIFDTYTVAKHILKKDIDSRLEKIDYSLVNEIALVRIRGKKKNFYSFASKYCNHHNSDEFPIYDSFVEKMLLHYRKTDNFDIFKKDDLKFYNRFIEIIRKFQDFYQLGEFSLRKVDIFLWLAGKKYFPKNYKKA